MYLQSDTLSTGLHGPAKVYVGLDAKKPVFEGLRTTQTQTSLRRLHPRSLISAFVIRDLEGTISKLATSEISFF